MGMLLSRHYADKAEGAIKEVAPEPSVGVKEDKPEHGIPASAIKSMNGTKLRKLAAENGIENPEELTVGELKAILIEKFG